VEIELSKYPTVSLDDFRLAAVVRLVGRILGAEHIRLVAEPH
jgi:hypothetical protein